VDQEVAPLGRLAGLQGHILDDAVALVEHAEDGDALGHWSDPDGRSAGPAGRGLAIGFLGLLAAPTCRERQRQAQ